MNNYSDLQATEFNIDIELLLTAECGHATVVLNDITVFDGAVVGKQVVQHNVPLLVPIKLEIRHTGVELASMCFDQWEARPQHGEYQSDSWKFSTDVPFYQWWHNATAQGWLLKPQ